MNSSKASIQIACDYFCKTNSTSKLFDLIQLIVSKICSALKGASSSSGVEEEEEEEEEEDVNDESTKDVSAHLK